MLLKNLKASKFLFSVPPNCCYIKLDIGTEVSLDRQCQTSEGRSLTSSMNAPRILPRSMKIYEEPINRIGRGFDNTEVIKIPLERTQYRGPLCINLKELLANTVIHRLTLLFLRYCRCIVRESESTEDYPIKRLRYCSV